MIPSDKNYHAYSFPVSHQNRLHNHQQSCTAHGCRCSGCCHSGNGMGSHIELPLQMHRKRKKILTFYCKLSMLFWAKPLCVLDSYSRGEVPHLNYPHNRYLHRISNEAGHIHGSCTQTERGGNMCR